QSLLQRLPADIPISWPVVKHLELSADDRLNEDIVRDFLSGSETVNVAFLFDRFDLDLLRKLWQGQWQPEPKFKTPRLKCPYLHCGKTFAKPYAHSHFKVHHSDFSAFRWECFATGFKPPPTPPNDDRAVVRGRRRL
ncbi:MAG: hypothetical protein Q9180_007775, partial [Flavoplaca navasiana]